MTFTAPQHSHLDWTPVSRTSGTMNSHNLVQVGEHRLELRRSAGILVIGLAMLVVGVVIPGGLAVVFAIKGWWAGTAIGVISGLGFIALGAILIGQSGKFSVIDKAQGWYWPMGTEPRGSQHRDAIAKQVGAIRLDDVALLQVLRKTVHDKVSGRPLLRHSGVSRPFVSTEINLVTHEGKRVNLVDHGDPIAITGQVKTLTHFLDLPVEENSLPAE